MRRTTRGFTLLEVVISLGILLVGMLGLMQFQLMGFGANQSARAQTRATQLALELRAGLEQIPYSDSALSVNGSWGSTAPPLQGGGDPFGSLLGADSTALGLAHTWNDASPIPGVTLDSALEQDPSNPGHALYARRWTVWGYSELSSMNAGSLIIAISVIYRDRGSPMPREVVVYMQRVNPAAVFSNIRISS
jgi:prepilin-type N-terminal cleavage/methylation domain-containing protein